MSTIWLFSFCSLDWDSLEVKKTLLGLSPHSFGASAHVIKTAAKSSRKTGIFFFTQNNYCKLGMMFVRWKEKEKMLGIRTAASDFLGPSFQIVTLVCRLWNPDRNGVGLGGGNLGSGGPADGVGKWHCRLLQRGVTLWKWVGEQWGCGKQLVANNSRWLQWATPNSLAGWRRSRVRLRANEPVLWLCPSSGGCVQGEGQ